MRLLILLTIIAYSSTTAAQRINSIAIIINDHAILQTTYAAQLQRNTTLWQRLNPDKQADALLLKEQTIRNIVETQIQLEEAKRIGIRVPDSAINEQLNAIALRENLTPAELQQHIIKEFGSILNYRKDLQNSIVIQELQRIHIRQRITISDAEIRSFLATTAGRSVANLQYSFSYVRIPKAANDKQNIYQQISDILHEDATVAQRQATLGSLDVFSKYFEKRPLADIPTVIQDIVPLQSLNTISPPIKNDRGWHIIQVQEIGGITPKFEEQIHTRHILLIPNIVRDDAQIRLQLEEIRNSIQQGGDFAESVYLNSDDSQSRHNGGDLGWKPYNAKFASITSTLPIGVISEPFATNIGWHIAEVLGRKKIDISVDQEFQSIRELLFKQKLADELPRWINELKGRAYIDIRV